MLQLSYLVFVNFGIYIESFISLLLHRNSRFNSPVESIERIFDTSLKMTENKKFMYRMVLNEVHYNCGVTTPTLKSPHVFTTYSIYTHSTHYIPSGASLRKNLACVSHSRCISLNKEHTYIYTLHQRHFARASPLSGVLQAATPHLEGAWRSWTCCRPGSMERLADSNW